MKRAPELRDLSDHHHRGLVQARRLRMAATGDGANLHEETAEAFLEFWPCKLLSNYCQRASWKNWDSFYEVFYLQMPRK